MSYGVYERPCDLCRTTCRVDLLERVEHVFPLGLVCPPCAAELRADEDDPHAGEPECDCRAYCRRCIGDAAGG